MKVTLTTSCPSCSESDATDIDLGLIEDDLTPYLITECISCAKPYVIHITDVKLETSIGLVTFQGS